MRYFNTSGPCNPAEHYTVLRRELIASGMEKVRRGKYLTIFAPRQAGKTTFLHMLWQELLKEGQYTPLQISFENLKNLSRDQFYEDLDQALSRELMKYGLQSPRSIKNHIHLARFLEELRSQCPQLVFGIDGFENIPKLVLAELLPAFRSVFHHKDNSALHSLLLAGVSTLAELIAASEIPFNVVDEIELPNFSQSQVRDLIGQYTEETGQKFDDEVINAIYENTNGQPGLVCALCAHLVEKIDADRPKPIALDDFHEAVKTLFATSFADNFSHIVQKADSQKPIVMRLLFTDYPIFFNIEHPDIVFLYAHGVVKNVDGKVGILAPLFKRLLVTAFRPASNGETGYYVSAKDNFSVYLQNDGLNIKAILQQYAAYVTKRGFRAFDVEQLKEGAWHYSLDGFINFFMESLGGQTFVEVPSGRGRTDILILFRGKKHIIETKIFSHLGYFEKGKRQLAEYVNSEGLAEGYYVVFSSKHGKDDMLEQDEIIDGKRIITLIIRVKFERPSAKRKKQT